MWDCGITQIAVLNTSHLENTTPLRETASREAPQRNQMPSLLPLWRFAYKVYLSVHLSSQTPAHLASGRMLCGGMQTCHTWVFLERNLARVMASVQTDMFHPSNPHDRRHILSMLSCRLGCMTNYTSSLPRVYDKLYIFSSWISPTPASCSKDRTNPLHHIPPAIFLVT